MKRRALATIGLLLLALFPCLGSAGDAVKRVAVLPPDVYGDKDLSALRSGLADLLASRIVGTGRIELAKPASVAAALGAQAGKPLDEEAVDLVAAKTGASAVVWGSLTTLGRTTSIVLKVTEPGDRDRTKHFSAIAGSQDEVLAKLGTLGEEIRASLGVKAAPPPAAVLSSAPVAPSAAPSTAPPPAPKEAPPAQGRAVAGTGRVFPFEGSSLWTSDELPFGARGMAVGDVDGDGRNEIVLIDQQNVYVYRLEKRTLALLATGKGKSYENYISVGLANGARGSVRRIFVTSMRDGPRSAVWEYRSGTLTPVLDDIPLFLRGVEGAGGPEVLGQGMEGKGWPYRGEVVRVDVEGSGASKGSADLPKGFSLYHFARADLKGDRKMEYVAVDGEGHLLVYSPSKEFLWQGRAGYEASCVTWKRARRDSDPDLAGQDAYGVPPPLLAADLYGDGVQELLAVKNPSQGWRSLLPGAPSGAQIEGLRWEKGQLVSVGNIDGLGGCVVGLAWEDVNGDGSKDLVAAAVVNPSALLDGARSAVSVYSKE